MDANGLTKELGDVMSRLEKHCADKDDEIASLKAELSRVKTSHANIQQQMFAMKGKHRRASIAQLWKHVAASSVLEKQVEFTHAALEALLASLYKVFDNDSSHEVIVDIIAQAKKLLRADGCAFYMMEDGELTLYKPKASDEAQEDSHNEMIAPEIAKEAADNNTTINIVDAHEDARFNKEADEGKAERTRELLAVPIAKRGADKDDLLGVAVLRNKNGTGAFSTLDEHLLGAFATYCAIALHNTNLVEEIKAKEAQHQVSLEMLSYHTNVEESKVEEYLKKVDGLSAEEFSKNAHAFNFDAYTLGDSDESVLFVYYMFKDMGLVDQFDLPRRTLLTFIGTVRKHYRDVPYHNWLHAISVTHQLYSFSKLVDLQQYFSDVQILALMVASLCHDIDHRGENNAFQKETHSSLSELYGSSVMERHHISQTLLLLNHSRCNIFTHFDAKTYREVLDTMKELILATDLALHFPAMKKIKELGIDSKSYDKRNQEHVDLMIALLMTCADLNTSTKDMPVHERVSQQIYEEFFKQGDEEKQFGQQPIEMMDREVANIPKIQVGFFDFIALPTYRLAAGTFPGLQPVLDNVEANRKAWAAMERSTEAGDASRLPTV